MADYFYDGLESTIGVSGDNPCVIPRNQLASQINRTNRFGINATRPGFMGLSLTFVDDTDGNNAKLFAAGNVQGAFFYNSYPSFNLTYLIVSIAGTIFKIQVIGKNGFVSVLFTGNEPVFTHAWFAQGFDWLVIQDGLNAPIVWNGVDPARRAVEGEVPTGSCMAFIHGRLCVASSDGTNQIAVGDIVYGNDATTTIDIIKFTDTIYWAEGGAFGVPVYVGNITGMYAMAYLDTGTGQNDLVVLGTEGAVSIDLSNPREQWKDLNILRISLIGGGCVSGDSMASMNGDLFFRSAEGVRSYKNARMEFASTWKQTPLSNDVMRWIESDTPKLLQFNLQVAWNNYLFSACSPMLAKANNSFAGAHRYHRGFVVLDAQSESNTSRTGSSAWYGLWTGIRPTAMIQGRIENSHRCFAFSYDCDGVNRLYEITKDAPVDSIDGRPIPIRSSLDTGILGSVASANAGLSNNFELKQLSGGTIELSDLTEPITVGILVKPNNSPCFIEVDSFPVGCPCVLPDAADCGLPFSWPQALRRNFMQNPASCAPGSSEMVRRVYHFQGRVTFSGHARLDRIRFRMKAQPSVDTVECAVECAPIDCCPDADAFYSVADTCGTNPTIPFITIPSDAPTYSSTQFYFAACPPGSSGVGTNSQATAYSQVSQADADSKALALATEQALSLLRCSDCAQSTLISFVANNDTTDLSAFFAASFLSNLGQPWRIYDTSNEIVYASGLIDPEGAMAISFAIESGVTYFNVTTHVFHDTGMVDLNIVLEFGCANSFPSDNPYGGSGGGGEETYGRRGPDPDVVGVVMVVHPAYAAMAPAAIASIDSQSRKFNWKVLVYDQGDDPNPPEIDVPQQWTVVRGNWKNPNPARNAGLLQSEHVTWLCFWDADNVMERDYLRDSLPHLVRAKQDVGVCYPMIQQTRPDGTCAQKLIDRGDWSPAKAKEFSLVDTASFWRVNALNSVSGWGEKQCRHDDYELHLRLIRHGFKGQKLPIAFNHVLHGANRSKWGSEQDAQETTESLWTAWSFGILTLWSGLNLKAHEQIFEWLLAADLPPTTYLHWVDNSGGKMAATLDQWAAQIRHKVKGISITSSGVPHVPSRGEPYLYLPRHNKVAALYNEAVPKITEDIIVTIEDDTLPPEGGLRKLVHLIRPGNNVAMACGYYRSRNTPGKACLSIDKKTWLGVEMTDIPSKPFEIGMSGVGFAIFANWALQKCLPQLCGNSTSGQLLGWDGAVCLTLTEKGYRMVCHPEVLCAHLCQEVQAYERRLSFQSTL